MNSKRPLATSEEVAEYLGVPLGTLRQWAYRGVGPKYAKVGRYRRYRWSDVEAYVDRQTKTGAA